MVSSTLFSIKSDEWATPVDMFNILNEEFHFNLDPCSTEENHKCDKYFTQEDDGLQQSWGGTECSATRHILKLVNGLKNATEKHSKIIH